MQRRSMTKLSRIVTVTWMGMAMGLGVMSHQALNAQEKTASAEVQRADKIKLVPQWGHLKFERPVSINVPPDGTKRHFLTQQTGKILLLSESRESGEAKVFFDVSDRDLVENNFEEGLIGMVFHPEFAKNGLFYVHYSQQHPKRSVISEFKVEGEPSQSVKADMASERILMEVPQPFWNHNSGNLIFGPDGYLYIAFGDGGKGDDPHLTAQNLFSVLGKILRIDVNSRSGKLPYGIPKDNPFVDEKNPFIGKNGARREIWAYGLRNPWGLYWDTKTQIFWAADVGQGLWEEVDHIVKGGNYGWSHFEGTHPNLNKNETKPADFKPIDPVWEYNHGDGISITGGFVYRGKAIPELAEHYIFGDWGSGRVWSLEWDAKEGKLIQHHELFRPKGDLSKNQFKPTAFCKDADDEMLILSWDGSIYSWTTP